MCKQMYTMSIRICTMHVHFYNILFEEDRAYVKNCIVPMLATGLFAKLFKQIKHTHTLQLSSSSWHESACSWSPYEILWYLFSGDAADI